ncbi:MAG: DNA primase [Thermodesulfobacteriota bacterium]
MAVYQRDDAVQRVKEAADIAGVVGEHVSLKRAGANLKGLCPFHAEKTPSFTVNPARGTYHCFGCGEGGDVINFVMRYHRLSFVEALRDLARRYQVELPEKPLNPGELERARKRDALYAVNAKAAELYHAQLLSDPSAQACRDYLAKRGIPQEIIAEFRLGFAPDNWNFLAPALTRHQLRIETAREAGLLVSRDSGGFYDRFRNRVMFPILDLTGRVVAFGGRILGEGQPKYMNSPESPVFDKSRTLFGLYQNREQIRKAGRCLVVEGNFDLLSLVVHGVRHVAAPLGTALTQHHVRALKGYAGEVILLFDGDQAGLKAAMRAVPLFLAEQVAARVVVLPDGHDPDTFIRAHGAAGLHDLVEAGLPLAEFVFARLVAQHGLGVDGKVKIVEELRELAKGLDDQHLQRTLFVSHFSKKLEISPEQLLGGVRAPEAKAAPAPPRPVGTALPMKQRQLLEFLISYPEYLAGFLEAGIEDIVVAPFGVELLRLLKEQVDQAGGPERLLELASGEARTFVSRLLIASPCLDEEVREHTAREMIEWLWSHSLKIRKQRLVQRISEAHRDNNQQLCLELMTQKKQLDEAMR